MQDKVSAPDIPPPARSADNLADYNTSLGQFIAFPKKLVQTYTNVLAQIFPLTANLAVLQQFCDGYLNLPDDRDPPPVRFTPAAPIVMLEVVDYGSIASNTPGAGWFSQREIAFGVPLDWQIKENGQWRSAGSAYIYPYIYVDNPLSVAGGRQIYGWSKAPVIFKSIPPIFQPTGPRCLLDVAIVDPGRSRGERGDTKDFFSVWQEQALSSARTAFPDLLTIVPRALTASINIAFDLFGASVTKSATTDRPSNLSALRAVITRLYGNLDSFLERAGGPDSQPASATPASSRPVSIITLKQVRDVPNTYFSSYQGIIESPMKIQRVRDAGLLMNPMIPDLSGGLSIDIADIAEQPVVQNLGIDNVRTISPQGKPEFRIKPLLPLWIRMDLTYGLADYQTWRTSVTGWTADNTPHYLPGGASDPVTYIELGSGAGQEVPGPFTFPKVTMRVFPLRAKRAPLEKLISGYLDNTLFNFDLTGSIRGGEAVVIGILSTFSHMKTPTRADLYSDSEFTLAVPVEWYPKDNPSAKQTALIPAYTFVGKEWNTDTSVEVYGRLTMTSEFFDRGSWPMQIPPSPKEPIVTIKSELFAEPIATQEAQVKPLFEFISERTRTSGGNVVEHLEAVGLPNLTGSAEISSIALKQVRDANDPAKADYQSLVWMVRKFQGDPEDSGALLASKNQKITIVAHEYPTMPIIQLLGLDGQATQENGFVRYVLEPVDAFYVRGSLSDEKTRNLALRVGKLNPWRA